MNIEKKTITVWFEGFSRYFKIENFYPLNFIQQHFNVIITNDNPQYIFCSNFNNYSFCKYDGIRIFMDYECYYPNLNIVDYAFLSCLSFENRDRCFKWSPSLLAKGEKYNLFKRNYTQEDLKSKNRFCNYIYSHDNYNIRTEIFKKLDLYKHVDSAGDYQNNMKGWHPGCRADASPGSQNSIKYDFQKECKFTIAYENFAYPSYNTEKILDAFIAGTIPIYYGDKDISQIYNSKAFINAMDYDSVEEVVEVVKKIDTDDEVYLNMLNQPIFNDEKYYSNMKKELDSFILHIFDQDYDKAFRRPMCNLPEQENYDLLTVTPYLQRIRNQSFTYKLIRAICHPSKLIKKVKKARK